MSREEQKIINYMVVCMYTSNRIYDTAYDKVYKINI